MLYEDRKNPGIRVTICGKKGAKNTRVKPVTGSTETYLVNSDDLVPVTSAGSPTIAEKFQSLEKFVKVVASRHSNGLFLSGPGGTGKTHTVMQVVRNEGLIEGTDYVVCKGYTTPAGLYNFLKDNSNKLVIFDDCDAVFKDITAQNILKAVLDTYPTRRVSWNTSVDMEPFDFTGRIIFISNLDVEQVKSPHIQAIMTRVLNMNVGSSREDVIARIEMLIPEICASLDEDTQQEIAEFLNAHADHWAKPSLRILVHVNSLVQWARTNNEDWKTLALSLET